MFSARRWEPPLFAFKPSYRAGQNVHTVSSLKDSVFIVTNNSTDLDIVSMSAPPTW